MQYLRNKNTFRSYYGALLVVARSYYNGWRQGSVLQHTFPSEHGNGLIHSRLALRGYWTNFINAGRKWPQRSYFVDRRPFTKSSRLFLLPLRRLFSSPEGLLQRNSKESQDELRLRLKHFFVLFRVYKCKTLAYLCYGSVRQQLQHIAWLWYVDLLVTCIVMLHKLTHKTLKKRKEQRSRTSRNRTLSGKLAEVSQHYLKHLENRPQHSTANWSQGLPIGHSVSWDYGVGLSPKRNKNMHLLCWIWWSLT